MEQKILLTPGPLNTSRTVKEAMLYDLGTHKSMEIEQITFINNLEENKMEQKILLTPGPLNTSRTVKEAMLYDLGTRDREYQDMVETLREKLLDLAHVSKEEYSLVFLQGSGTYGVESVLEGSVGKQEKVLILSNGAYGERMEQICKAHGIPYQIQSFSKLKKLPVNELEPYIAQEDITHVAFIHCETTAGVLNDIEEIMELIHRYKKISIVDAMSSFGSMDLNLKSLGIDFLITSSNKCLHGVPGVALIYGKKEAFERCEGKSDTLALNLLKSLGIDFLITSSNKCLHGVPGVALIYGKKEAFERCEGKSDTLALNLYEQWKDMEQSHGAFRFTSPTHVLLALNQAVKELEESGGITARHEHYILLQKMIRDAMEKLGFDAPVSKEDQAPVITTYFIPDWMDFSHFYEWMKERGILLYSGKLPGYQAFRIGNIGDLTVEDMERVRTEICNYVKEYKR